MLRAMIRELPILDSSKMQPSFPKKFKSRKFLLSLLLKIYDRLGIEILKLERISWKTSNI